MIIFLFFVFLTFSCPPVHMLLGKKRYSTIHPLQGKQSLLQPQHPLPSFPIGPILPDFKQSHVPSLMPDEVIVYAMALIRLSG